MRRLCAGTTFRPFSILLIIIFTGFPGFYTGDANESAFRIGRLEYRGGGDWYVGPSAEPNLLEYIRQNTNIPVNPVYESVDLMSDRLFSYSMIFMTGHGNVSFNAQEIQRLREYLRRGGFLYADDCYGMDAAFRREMKKLFPDQELVEIPFSHPIYTIQYQFPNGPPKIHEHDGKPPQGFGLFMDGRLVVYYTYEADPHDGWVDERVHGNPWNVRERALQFGTNLVLWLLTKS
jgi:hypothetical protein